MQSFSQHLVQLVLDDAIDFETADADDMGAGEPQDEEPMGLRLASS